MTRTMLMLALVGGFARGAVGQIIWDNGANAGLPMSSQRDDSAPFESQIADDFLLPTGPGGETQWEVTDVFWSGTYFNNQGAGGAPDEFNIFIYADDGTGNAPTLPPNTSAILQITGIPFANVNQTPDPGGAGFNYGHTLAAPFVVDADTKYWLVIQSDMDFTDLVTGAQNGQWGWNQTIAQAVLHEVVGGFPLGGVNYWTTASAENFFNATVYATFRLGGRPVPSACSGFLCGDSNCDGALNGGDIDAFFFALVLPDDWQNAYPNCDRACVVDTNGDEHVDGADIDVFLEALKAGQCP